MCLGKGSSSNGASGRQDSFHELNARIAAVPSHGGDRHPVYSADLPRMGRGRNNSSEQTHIQPAAQPPRTERPGSHGGEQTTDDQTDINEGHAASGSEMMWICCRAFQTRDHYGGPWLLANTSVCLEPSCNHRHCLNCQTYSTGQAY